MSDKPPSPVLPGERIVALDVIRGLAICGVLVAYCAWSLGTLPPDRLAPFDRSLDLVLAFLVDGKFYTLLAFLFGLGFHLQLERGRGDDGEAIRLYRRRLWILAGIGLVHAVLLRNGDILLPYALVGLLLTFLRRESGIVLFAAALLAFLLPFLLEPLWEASPLPMPDRPETAGQSYFASNLAWLGYWYSTAVLVWPPILTLFVAGLWVGRNHVVERIAGNRSLAIRLLAGGLAVGIGLFAARIWLAPGLPPSIRGQAAGLLFTLHAWGLATAYAAALLLALRSAAGARALHPLAAAGRMALTNYLLQPILIVPICLHFGLFDRFTPTSALLLAATVIMLQLPFSVIWLRHFDFGPAEWLWRYLTYGRVPMSRRTEAPL